jgi:hypothetical protein
VTASFNFPGTEDAATVSIDEDGDDQFRVVGALSQFTVMALQLRGVELLEDIFVEVALMTLAEQIENISWKHEPLVEFDGAWLEWRFHGIITAVLMAQLYHK